MQAWQVSALGVAAQRVDLPRPEPQAGEALVRIEACGLNFADLLMGQGKYQERPALPYIPGMEFAGVVEALGSPEQCPPLGSRVAGFAGAGGLAEYACLPAARLVVLPEAMSFAEAAAFQIAYGTSHLALEHRAHLAAGETLLVLGAAGGVGLDGGRDRQAHGRAGGGLRAGGRTAGCGRGGGRRCLDRQRLCQSARRS